MSTVTAAFVYVFFPFLSGAFVSFAAATFWYRRVVTRLVLAERKACFNDFNNAMNEAYLAAISQVSTSPSPPPDSNGMN